MTCCELASDDSINLDPIKLPLQKNWLKRRQTIFYKRSIDCKISNKRNKTDSYILDQIKPPLQKRWREKMWNNSLKALKVHKYFSPSAKYLIQNWLSFVSHKKRESVQLTFFVRRAVSLHLIKQKGLAGQAWKI